MCASRVSSSTCSARSEYCVGHGSVILRWVEGDRVRSHQFRASPRRTHRPPPVRCDALGDVPGQRPSAPRRPAPGSAPRRRCSDRSEVVPPLGRGSEHLRLRLRHAAAQPDPDRARAVPLRGDLDRRDVGVAAAAGSAARAPRPRPGSAGPGPGPGDRRRARTGRTASPSSDQGLSRVRIGEQHGQGDPADRVQDRHSGHQRPSWASQSVTVSSRPRRVPDPRRRGPSRVRPRRQARATTAPRCGRSARPRAPRPRRRRTGRR